MIRAGPGLSLGQPSRAELLGSLFEPPLHPLLHQNLCRNLLHRKMRGIDMRNILPPEQILHFPYLKLALRKARIPTIRLPLMPNSRQPVRIDSQTKQLVLMILQRRRQLQPLHIILGQRIVRRPNPKLHSHVQTSRRLPTPRNPHQDQIRLVVVMRPRPVIVIQRKVHRLDPLHVVGVAADRVRFPHGIRRVGRELLLQRGEEGGEDVDHEAVGGGEHLADVLVDDGVEDDRAYAVTLGRGVDLLHHHPGLVDAVDVRAGELVERNVLELG